MKMNCFDFPTELVYGKRHLRVLNYDVQEYDFVSAVTDIFQYDDLNELHQKQVQHYELFREFGKDNNTEFHNHFYAMLKTEKGNEIRKLFNRFVKKVILPDLNLQEALVQTFPTFRVHLPNNVAVALPHQDHELGHPIGEINFTIALTKMWGSNSVWIEKMPRSEMFTSIELEQNNCISFNGNLCQHYNQVNTTGKTRVSMDFRVLPLNYYVPATSVTSISTSQKFVEGGYYSRMKI